MISDFEYLNNSEIRQKFESNNQIFVTEGEKIFRRALELDFAPRSILTTPEWLLKLDDEQVSRFELHVMDVDEISSIAGYPVHRGLLATFSRGPDYSLEDVLNLPGQMVLLEGLTDLENLGTIFRTATALGVSGILLDSKCPDPLFRRCLKASMGAALQMPFAVYPNLSDLLSLKGERALVGLSLSSSMSISGTISTGDEILAFGSEGDGLSADLLASCDDIITIPMSQKVDSLNVGAAAAIAIWEFQQRVGG
jgi:tRNA G18 (ribose-2'-O)-methylase SpoU